MFPKGGCHLCRFFLYFPARWVSFKKIFFCILVSKWVVSLSHISISSLSVNTSLIVGNLLWKVFNHYHLSSALALFTSWLIKAAGLSVQLVDLWSKDVYTIYVAMMKSIHTTCQICAFAHWSLCNLFVWWSHDHFMRQWMKHNFTHFPLSHAERKKCGGDFFSKSTKHLSKWVFKNG